MSNHKQPLEVAEVKGALKWNPRRYKDRKAKSRLPLGQPPKRMSDAAKEIWFELETYSLPGVLTGAERTTMELLSNLLAEYHVDPRAFPANKYGPIISCLARLGMTPADRQKVIVKDEEEDTKPHQEFAQ